MPKAEGQIERLRIAEPCKAGWEEMAGDERVRHCTLCSLNVYNFAEMSRDEIRQVLVRTEGRVCARLYRRADGTVLTRDCPGGLRALRRRASRVATALIAALLTLPALAFGGPNFGKPRLKTRGARVKLRIERVVSPQPAVLSGVVRDVDGGAIPGVSVSVRNEASKRVFAAVTDVDGAFKIPSLDDGHYRVDVTLDGFTPAVLEHLQLKASEVTHAAVALRLNAATMTIIVGAIAPDPMRNGAGSTTFSQDLINKLPL